MRALVTGSTGFTGRWLTRALARRNIAVTAVSCRSHNAPVRSFDFGSISTWIDTLRDVQPDMLFHLSGVARAATRSELVNTNILATSAILDAMRHLGLRRCTLILIGTAAEYGLVPSSALPVTEQYVCRPVTDYGITKHTQTLLGLSAASTGQRVVVLRPSNLIGPGMSEATAIGSFAAQLSALRNGLHEPVLRVGNIDTRRDFVDVRDAVDLFVELAQCEAAVGKVINISSGVSVSMRTVIEQLCGLFDVAPKLVVDTGRLRAFDLPDFCADPGRLRSLTKVVERIPLDQTLRDLAGAAIGSR